MFAKMSGLEKSFTVLGVIEIIGGVILALVSYAEASAAGPIGQFVGYSVPLIWLVAGIVFGMLFLAVANGLYYLRNIMESGQGQSPASDSEAIQRTETPEKMAELHRFCQKCGGTFRGTQAWRGPNQWAVRCHNCGNETAEHGTEALAWQEWDEKNKI